MEIELVRTRSQEAPMRSLLARYVRGQIEPPVFAKFMAALDDCDAHPAERLALAAHLDDAVANCARPDMTMEDIIADFVTPSFGG